MLAQDRSLRKFDADGRLHVEQCNISKANVCGYYGREIPNADGLGLDPNKIYQLYRDPAELAAAASTFNNLPLLLKHVVVSAEAPEQDLTVGTIGSDVRFEAPYLVASIAVWTAEAIALIESGKLAELSPAYRYTADMTPGEIDGLRYDGVMRNIIGNHLALVDQGRTGPDVFVSDEKPLELRKMRFPKFTAQLAALLAISATDPKLLALDAAMEEDMEDGLSEDEKLAACDAMMKEMGKDALTDEDKAAAYKRAAKDKKAALDTTPPAAPEGGAPKPAQDEKPVITQKDIDAARAIATDEAVKRVNALHVARADVATIVGDVALESAEGVYKFALDHLKVDLTDVPAAAYPAMFKVAAQAHAAKARTPSTRVATDAAAVASVHEAFPDLARFRVS